MENERVFGSVRALAAYDGNLAIKHVGNLRLTKDDIVRAGLDWSRFCVTAYDNDLTVKREIKRDVGVGAGLGPRAYEWLVSNNYLDDRGGGRGYLRPITDIDMFLNNLRHAATRYNWNSDGTDGLVRYLRLSDTVRISGGWVARLKDIETTFGKDSANVVALLVQNGSSTAAATFAEPMSTIRYVTRSNVDIGGSVPFTKLDISKAPDPLVIDLDIRGGETLLERWWRDRTGLLAQGRHASMRTFSFRGDVKLMYSGLPVTIDGVIFSNVIRVAKNDGYIYIISSEDPDIGSQGVGLKIAKLSRTKGFNESDIQRMGTNEELVVRQLIAGQILHRDGAGVLRFDSRLDMTDLTPDSRTYAILKKQVEAVESDGGIVAALMKLFQVSFQRDLVTTDLSLDDSELTPEVLDGLGLQLGERGPRYKEYAAAAR